MQRSIVTAGTDLLPLPYLPIGVRIGATRNLMLAVAEPRRVPPPPRPEPPRPHRGRLRESAAPAGAPRRRRRRRDGKPLRILSPASRRHEEEDGAEESAEEQQQRGARSSSPSRSCHARTGAAGGVARLPRPSQAAANAHERAPGNVSETVSERAKQAGNVCLRVREKELTRFAVLGDICERWKKLPG